MLRRVQNNLYRLWTPVAPLAQRLQIPVTHHGAPAASRRLFATSFSRYSPVTPIPSTTSPIPSKPSASSNSSVSASESNSQSDVKISKAATVPTSVSNFLGSAKQRSRRALFYVPGSEERKLKSSLTLPADCMVYDLEDGVAANRKGAARQLVMDALEASEHGKAEKAVRINAIGSGLELDDLNVVLRSKRLQAIVIPKVQSAKDVQFVSRMVDSLCPEVTRENIRLIASIESALGIMNLREIALSDSRLDALIFAAEDYCAEMGLTRTPSRKEMLFARQALVTAAGAYGLQAIDLVCLDYKNDAILEEECKEGREWGYAGKQAIHPKQIEIIQNSFLPTQSDIDWASKIVQGYEEHIKRGIGAFSLDGKVVDLPVVKWADRVLTQIGKSGVKEK